MASNAQPDAASGRETVVAGGTDGGMTAGLGAGQAV
jgi:hypothetical protein